MQIISNKKKAIQELNRISTRTSSSDNDKVLSIVEEILQNVKNNGDIAVKKYTQKFDGFNPDPLQVSALELKNAWNQTDDNLKSSLKSAYERIKKFHEKEIPCSFTI